MEFAKIRQKAMNGQLKLEDLDVEDILKFLSLGFINVELANHFHISISQVKKIRKQKNISDAEYENEIRNLILYFDYVSEHYPYLPYQFKTAFARANILALGIFRGKENYYLQKLKDID